MSKSETVFRFRPGTTPLLVSVPHAGTELLDGMREYLTPEAGSLPDTDWQVDALYRRAGQLGAGLLVANYSRYVVDLNRPSDDHSLYDSATTGLFPRHTFAGDPVWREDPWQKHSREEIMATIWRPYHQQIHTELERLRDQFGYAILLDAHSIAARVPALFDGRLPDLNLGSNDARSAAPDLLRSAWRALESPDYSRVLDGRFKGGAITRGFGRPTDSVHALQLELSQATYWDAERGCIDTSRASRLMAVLQDLLRALIDWRPP